MPRPVNARIPLSLLESIRRIDTPQDQADTEYVPELRNKRLGLSDTVYTQIRRYTDALKRGQKIPFAEAEGLGTLIGRRPDSSELFRSAGEILANDIYQSMSPTTRATVRVLPKFLSRPMALKHLTAIADKYFGGTLAKSGSFVSLRVSESGQKSCVSPSLRDRAARPPDSIRENRISAIHPIPRQRERTAPQAMFSDSA